MDNDLFVTTMEALQNFSTEVWAVLILYLWSKHLMAMTFSLDLFIILLTILASRYMNQHLILKPMGDRVGHAPPYNARQQDEIYQIFLRGLEEEHRPSGRTSAVRRPQ